MAGFVARVSLGLFVCSFVGTAKAPPTKTNNVHHAAPVKASPDIKRAPTVSLR
ncbi:MAG: hypothetical protein SF187_20215 [Deltaproteobacteria bacterium]|nr:hypothetical protein [Deltaproteobacteria bacterium]